MRLSVFYLYSSPLDCECKGRIESLFSLTLLNAGVIPPTANVLGSAGQPQRQAPHATTHAAAGRRRRDSYRNTPDTPFRALPDCKSFPSRLILKCGARAGAARTGREGHENAAVAQAPADHWRSKAFQSSGLQRAVHFHILLAPWLLRNPDGQRRDFPQSCTGISICNS